MATVARKKTQQSWWSSEYTPSAKTHPWQILDKSKTIACCSLFHCCFATSTYSYHLFCEFISWYVYWDATSSRNRTNVVHIHEAWCWGACRFNCLNSKQNKKWETQKKGRSYHRDKLKYIFILSQAQQLDWQAAENTWKFIYSWDCIWSYQRDLRGFISKYV